MKKVLIINGSYREDGDTVFLINNFLAGLSKSSKLQIEIVDLKTKKFGYCQGCWECGNEENLKKPIGECKIKDDEMRELLERSLASDILVYATPVYEMGPTAILKKFLERNLPVLGRGKFGVAPRNPKRKDKIGVILLTSGAPWPINVLFGITRYPIRLLKFICRLHGCSEIYVLPAGGIGTSPKMKTKWGKKANALGKKIA